MRKSVSRSLAGVSLGTVSLLLAAHASAQSLPPPPPQPVYVDENGVDLASRKLQLAATDLRIGPDDHRGLQLGRQLASYGWRLTSTPVISGNSTDAVVVYQGRSVSFSLVNSAYVADVQDGATLSSDASVFTAADGTVIQFQNVQDLAEHASAFKAAQKITFPDGVEHTFTYQTGWQLVVFPNPEQNYYRQSNRLTSINSSTGHQLKLGYLSNDSEHNNWRLLNRVISINNAVEHCSPAADTCSLSGNWPQVTYGAGLYGTPAVTDPEGRTTSYTYSNGRVTSIIPPGSGSSPVTYTYTGDQVASVSRGGGTWTYTAPSADITRVDRPSGAYTNYTSDPEGFITKRAVSRDGSIDTTAFLYCQGTPTCPTGRIQQITSPEQNYTYLVYDARGNVTSQTSYPKPGTGLAPITRNAAYPATCSNIRTCNKPVSVTDGRGNVTDLTWDPAHGGLTMVQAPAPAAGSARPTTTISYSPVYARYLVAPGTWVNSPAILAPDLVRACQTAATCNGTGNELVTDFDYPAASAANNTLATSVTRRPGDSSIAQTIAIGYSDLGDVVTVDGPRAGTVDLVVSFSNRARQQTGALGPGDGSYPNLGQRISYDSAGRPWKVESGSTTGQTASALASMTVSGSAVTTFDTYSRPVTQADLGSDGVTYSLAQTSYDTSGRPTCVTVRMNPSTFGSLPSDACTLATQGTSGPDRITKYTYDALDRAVKVTQGFGTADAADAYTLTFTANGQLASARDANSNLTTYLYDGHDRNYQVRYPVTTKGASASSTTDYEQYGLDANGNVTTFRTRAGETLTLAYDNLNRLTSKIVPERSGLSTTHTRDVYYAYNLFGSLTAARFDSPSGEGMTFAYDGLGRQTTETQALDGTSRTITSYYDVTNNRIQVAHPDGNYVYTSLDIYSRPYVSYLNGSNPLIHTPFDAAGRKSVLYRWRPAVGWDQYTSYSYDAASRLSSQFQNPNNTSYDATTTFAFNPASQITSRTSNNDAFAWPGHIDVTRSYTSNGLNQYTAAGSATFTYDGSGNLRSDGTYYYTYDVENRLVAKNNGTVLRYDPLGRLYEVNGSSTGITRFLHDGSDLITEYNSSSTLLRRYVHGLSGGDDPLVWFEGSGVADSQRRYLYADERGSVVAVTDGSGNTATINSYDEYGIPDDGTAGAITTKGRFRYTGQAWLPELGMYYYKARMYSPTLGRFMQTDPIGYGDGMNMYRYAGNDPVNAVDPTGLRCESHGGQKGDYCDPSHPGDDAPPIPVVALRQTVYIGGGGGINFGGLFITQPGVYAGGGIRLTVLEKPQSDGPEEGDLGECLLIAGKGFVDGALDPEAAALALGVSAWHAANRTAAEDYRPLTNDERAQPRNRGTLKRSFGSALRIGAKRAIPGYLAISAAVGVVNGVITAVNDPNCKIK